MTMVGSRILHYRITGEIGAGGMGVVYLAEDEKLHRQVALKFVAKSIQEDRDARDRLIREARAASALNHPNIVSIHAIEETPEHVFIVMEYVEGQSIHDLVRRGEMTWQRALELAPQILSALAAAHERGIVHRDIKSDNIILTSRGQIKVLDFGLARGHEAATFVTRVGSSAGTPAFMSPEQIQDGEVDARSDLFSFGVVLYQMLTGRMAFKGEHEAALTYSIVNETPTEIRTHNKTVPASLQNVVMKLLQKNPRDRYQTAADVIADLARVETGQRVSGPHRRFGARWLAGAAAVIAVGVVAVWFLRGRAPAGEAGAPGAPGRKMVVVLPFENLGPADQEYFADGVTEEITTRLAQVGGLGVISRTSAMKYKGSKRSLREISKELGIDYALEGSVRWDKSGGKNNVRISAQLIRANDDTHLWAESFDRVFDQIFALQSEIAEKVADELDVALGAPERAALAVTPTRNLDAYDVYLKARDMYRRAISRADMDSSVAMAERAVRLDSTFADAQGWLARTYSNQYFAHVHPELPRLAQARKAAAAAGRHAPDQPVSHIALGYYHYYGSRNYEKALEQFAQAQKEDPNNSDVLEAMSYVQRRQGKWDESVRNLERAVSLDPRSTDKLGSLTTTYLRMRRWDDVDRCVRRGMELAPDLPFFPAQRAVRLMLTGDVAGARRLVEAVKAKTPVPQIDDFLAQLDIMDRDYAAVHRHMPHLGRYPEEDTTSYYAQRGQAYHFAGDKARAAAYFDSARVVIEARAKRHDSPEIMMGYAELEAALGHEAVARRYADEAVRIMPVERDAVSGVDLRDNRVIMYLILHDDDAALRELEFLLSVPSNETKELLRLHPGFDRLRDNPRFKKLIEAKLTS